MMPKENPFKLIGYHGPELFCDREKELNRLTEYAENGINTTLFSLRRMGKTGLIQHFFHQLQQTKSHNVVYVDVYDSSNLHQFTNRLATALLNTFPEKKSVGKKFMALLRGFSPVISYDPFTGIPQVELHFSSYQQNQQSLVGLFDFLEQQKKRTVVAIDEFQQIAHYPEKNTEATLRTIIQPLKKINFIFSGSHKHLLLQIFSNANRPFFSSTSPLHLDRIPEESYAAFIQYLFKESKRRNLLTKGQWNLLIAIAKENQVYEPTGARFTAKYHLGNPASVRRSLLALIDKEMVFKESSDEIYYEVYNCFLSRWLALKF
jgi:AAA+ ATPase superfamily predicted ATPase